MTRPFRFGVSTTTAESPDDWRNRAKKAEDLGFDTFFAADHLRQSFQPMIALAFAAEATTRIRIGTFVINNDFRSPVLLAREAATLDFLSGGRLELGLGAGHSGDEYDEAGIPFNEPKVRVARLEESVWVIKSLWSEERTSFTGEHYRVTEHQSFPKPPRGAIPLLIGGNGKDLLQLAAREADIVGFTGAFIGRNGYGRAFPHFTAEGLANRLEVVREAAGSRFEELELNVLVQGVETADPNGRLAEWSKQLGLSEEDLRGSPFVLFGSVDEIVDRLERYRERFGVSYIATHWHGMDALAPVVARLAGR